MKHYCVECDWEGETDQEAYEHEQTGPGHYTGTAKEIYGNPER